MSTIMTEAVLYDLLSWMSPSWPIGAFAHSSGLEWAVEAGLVTDRAATEQWLADWIEHGGGGADAVLFAFAHRAASALDGDAVLDLAQLSLALQTTAERRLETVAQGGAFRRIARSTAGCRALNLLDDLADDEIPYPIVAACVMAGHGAPLEWALTAFLHGTVANLASAAQRLIPLGQTDGQLVIAALRPHVAEAARRAMGAEGEPFDCIGSAALMADFASMAHETQYTRLFRT
jgi:urease accessory protein